MSIFVSSLPIKNIAATTYTTSDDDNGYVIIHNNAAASTITLHASAPPGFNVSFVQDGAGQVTFAAASGATINSNGAKLKTSGQYAAATAFVKRNAGGAAVYNLQGDITT